MKGVEWSEAEKASLTSAVRRGVKVQDMVKAGAVRKGRTVRSIHSMILRLGLAKRQAKWSEADVAALKQQEWPKLLKKFTPAQITRKQYHLAKIASDRHLPGAPPEQ